MPRTTKSCILLLSLLLCSQAKVGQTQQAESSAEKDAEAILRLNQRLRTVVDSEANPAPGMSPVKPDVVWRAHEDLFGENLELTVEVLSEVLDSGDLMARALAARLLGNISGQDVRRSLANSAAQDLAPSVRLAALDGLRTASGFLGVCRLLREFERGAELRASSPDIARAQGLLEKASVETSARYDLPEPAGVQVASTSTPESEKVLAEEIAEIWEIWGKEGTADEARKRLRNLGPAAIRPLTDRLWKDYVYGWFVARLMLGDLGGTALVEPISEIVRTHPERQRRILALEMLLRANGFFEVWNFFSERIEAEEDPAVRGRAIAYSNACVAGPWAYEAEPEIAPSRP